MIKMLKYSLSIILTLLQCSMAETLVLQAERDNTIYSENTENSNGKFNSLFSGKISLDLIGGVGVDTYFLSKVFKSIDYVDISKNLAEITQGNFGVLKAYNF